MSSANPRLSAPPLLTLAQIALDELQDAILSGRLPTGSQLRLEETSRALGMSPSPRLHAHLTATVGRVAKHMGAA